MLPRLLFTLASAPLLLRAAVPLLEDAKELGIPSGSAAPRFSLRDQNGRTRDAQSLMGRKGLVLVFFRSADWCVYCKLQLVQLQRDLPAIQNAGLGLAAVSYDSPAVLRNFAVRRAITFPLLSDHQSETIRAFGVANRHFRKGTLLDVDTETVTNALGNVPVDGISCPAVFILDPDGKVRWRFVSEADELRLTGAAILERSMASVSVQNRRPVEGSGKVRVSVRASNAAAGLGNRMMIGVEIELPPGLHVYSPEVAGEYRGVSWRMNQSGCWTAGEAKYPEPRWMKFEFSEEKLPVYENSIHISRELAIQPVLSASDPAVFETFKQLCLDKESRVKASGELSFQACDDRQCYPPKSILVDWRFQFLPLDRERVPPEIRREFEP